MINIYINTCNNILYVFIQYVVADTSQCTVTVAKFCIYINILIYRVLKTDSVL